MKKTKHALKSSKINQYVTMMVQNFGFLKNIIIRRSSVIKQSLKLARIVPGYWRNNGILGKTRKSCLGRIVCHQAMKSSHVIRRFAQHQTTTQNNTWVPTFSETSHTSCFIRMCGTVKTSTSSGQRTWKSAILKPSVNRRSLCLVGIYPRDFSRPLLLLFSIYSYIIFFIQCQCINQELGHYSCFGDKRL